MIRRIVYLASVLIVLLALINVPFPYVLHTPGEAVVLTGGITVSTQADPLSGELSLLTVRTKEARALDILRGWLDRDGELLGRTRIIPAGTTPDDHFRRTRALFRTQVEISATAVLRNLGEPIALSTVVRAVFDNTPADGVLQSGDVLVSVAGVSADSIDALLDALAERDVGDEITVVFDRDGERREAAIIVELLPGRDTVGMGVQLERVGAALPFDIELDDRFQNIGGSSAGLVMGIAIHDLLAEEDLLRDRSVTVTGTLDVDGNVGTVGGLRQKIIAARDADTDLVIVPRAQLAEARDVADALTIIGVDSLADAIEALRA